MNQITVDDSVYMVLGRELAVFAQNGEWWKMTILREYKDA